MSEDELTRQLLTTGAKRLADEALRKQQDARHAYLGVYHWLLVLIERHAPMAKSMVEGFHADAVKAQILEKLGKGEVGTALAEDKVVLEAAQLARQRDRSQATERDVAAVVLAAAGFTLSQSLEGIHIVHSGDLAPNQSQPSEQQRIRPQTPALDEFGRDLTAAARDGKLGPVIGRDEETDLVVENLCRRSKRNPVLVGPAGVGKTAIVEGLAQRIAQGKVPEPLIGARIVALQPSILLAGAHMAGELEKRMKAIIEEASQEGILLFIDEIHTIMGAGGAVGTTDMGSMIKPSLARGDLACIAATTDDEYRKFIETDSALERRFQPIRVQELSPEQTLEVLRSLRVELMKKHPVEASDEVLKWLIEFGQQFMRNRYFPDKAVDLLEQCYAHSIALGKNKVELVDARAVAQRMVGMPVVSTERLAILQTELVIRHLLTEEEIQILIGRLQVTLRGLDMRAARPNAVVLLLGDAAENSQALSEAIARTLFGSVERVINIDFSRFGQAEDLNLLVGSPPGYVGYSDRLPLHGLLQTPWCVLHFERVDACHPRIREVLGQALQDGWIMDGRGKNIYLSDTVVVMTADVTIQNHRSLGFQAENQKLTAEELFNNIAEYLGETLASQADLFSFGLARLEGVSVDWLKEHFLIELGARYLKQGVRLAWDASFLDWLSNQENNQYGEHDWENWVDRYLTPAIIPYLPSTGPEDPIDVIVSVEGNDVKVNESHKEG